MERFFEKFGVLSEVPGSITNLRELIRSLAVQGRLLRQKPADEPVVKAVRRSGTLPAPPRMKKRSPSRIQGVAALSVGPTERAVPDGWACLPIVDVARIESGHTPSRSRPDWWSGDIPWVGIVDARLGDGQVITETIQHTNAEGLANSAARLLPPGTVCVSRTASVGYVVVLGQPMATSQDFVNWVPSPLVTSDWLRLVFQSERKGLRRFSKGAVHQTIYYPEWLAMHILLPPLAEQKRIAAKVDELMSLCDRLETQQHERETRHAALASAALARFSTEPTPANLGFLFYGSFDIEPRGLRQAVLALAIRGKLEPQSTNDEPVDDLLRRIQAKRRSLLIARRAADAGDLPPVVGEERPFEVPDTWRWFRFGSVSICRDGQRIPVSKDERAGRQGHYDYYGASGVIDKIDGYLFDEPLLLIGEDGANLLNRSTPIAFLAGGRYWVNNHAHVLDSDSVDVLRYLALVFNAIDLSPFVTGTAQPKMNQAKMNSIPIPVPPVEEQRRIVAKVDHLMALIDELEARLVASRAEGKKLLEAVVAELTQATRAA